MRVQKLGGFDAIADNRVWKNLFEDLSEPGKCVTQGMTKRKYERFLLPFERYERELKENGKYKISELTISTIPKNFANRKESPSSRLNMKRHRSTSPAIEIIPLKNGGMEREQINEIQNLIKSKDYENQYFNGNSNDGVAVPVHVIVRPSANGYQANNHSMRKDESNSGQGSSRFFKSVAGTSGHQKPKEKENQSSNIPLMLQSHTTIMPLTREGLPKFSQVVELVDSDDDGNYDATGSNQPNKKRKLDILREGGLEVTPISRKAQADRFQISHPHQSLPRQSMQPNVSLMSLSPVRAPPVIQSLNMYQSTSQVFKNPKEDVINAARNSKTYCLDLTSKPHQLQNPHDSADMYRDNRRHQTSAEEVLANN